MTTKELISILASRANEDINSIHSAAKTKKGRYELRPIRKVTKKKHTKSRVTTASMKKGKLCCIPNSAVMHRLPTSVTTVIAAKENLPKNVGLHDLSQTPNPDTNMDVGELIQDADFINISDMEDDAFQLATFLESNDPQERTITFHLSKYLESNDQQDRTRTSLQDKFPRNSTSSIAFDPEESANDKILVRLLDNIGENSTYADYDVNAALQNQSANQTNSTDFNVNNNRPRRNPFSEPTLNLSEPSITAENHKSLRHSALPINVNERKESPSSTSVAVTPNQPVIKDIRSTLSNPNPSNLCGGITDYITLTKNDALHRKMVNLFNRTCYNYLNGRLCGRCCKWNHNLPATYDIYQKLMCLPDDSIAYMYANFVLKSNTSFVTYFPTMCDVFGNRNMTSILLRVIKDCEKREKIPFLKFVFNGLVTTGLTKRDALTMVTDYSCKSRACYDIFLEIIIETDAVHFIDMLEKYYFQGTISEQSMLKLLQQVTDTQSTSFLTLFINILDKYSMYDALDAETFQFIMSRAKKLVMGNLSLSQKLNHIAERMQPTPMMGLQL